MERGFVRSLLPSTGEVREQGTTESLQDVLGDLGGNEEGGVKSEGEWIREGVRRLGCPIALW